MKYLKLFEWWKPEYLPKNIGDDIRDICLELKDDGFMVSHNYNYKSRINDTPNTGFIKCEQSIIIQRKSLYFSISQVSECILRLQDFLNSEGYQLKMNISYTDNLFPTDDERNLYRETKYIIFKTYNEVIRTLQNTVKIPKYSSDAKARSLKRKVIEKGNNITGITLLVLKK